MEPIHSYDLLEPLARSGPGAAFRAVVAREGSPLAVGTEVVLRVLTEKEAGGAAVFERLKRDHEAARSIASPIVLAPLDFGVAAGPEGGRFWSVSAWAEGRTLAEVLAGADTLPDPFVDAIAKPAADALVAVHEAGLCAVGLSPDLLLVQADTSILLLDPAFGSARAATLPDAGPLSPTLACAAPEAIRARDRADGRADLYSLGAVLFRAMTGRWHRPDDCQALRCEPESFESRRPSAVHPRLSILLDELVFALLQPDRSRRIASAKDLAVVLNERRESAWWRGLNIAPEPQAEQRAAARRRTPAAAPPPVPVPKAGPDAEWIRTHRTRGLRLARHPAPLVAREDELRALLDAASRLADRGGRVRLVQGEAGSGKTRLVDALLESLELLPEDERPLVLAGEHRRLGIGRPMRAFNEGLTRLVSPTRDVTEDQVAPLLGDASAIAPAFAAFLSGNAAPPKSAPLTREAISAAFVRSLARLCQLTPVVFVVENLQWAEPEGLALFEQLARLAGGMPLLLVGTFQPAQKSTPLANALNSMRAHDHVGTVKVGPLSASDAIELALTMIAPDAQGVALAKRIGAAGGESPWRVVETVRLLEAEGLLLRSSAGPLAATQRALAAEVPESREVVVARRLALLGAAERAVLAMAAVQGFAFDADVVRLALGVGHADMERALTSLTAGALVEGSGPARRFASNPLFDHVHDSLDDAAFASCHQATATAFLASRNREGLPPSETHGILSYRVAWHYLLGGSARSGLLYVPAAMRHLRSTWRIGDAERLSEIASRALAAETGRTGELVDMLLTRTEFLALETRGPDAREVADDALLKARAAGDVGRQSAVLLRSAQLRLGEGDTAAAVADAREALAAAASAGNDAVAAECQALLGTIAFRESRFQDARQHANETLEIARRRSDVAAEAKALHALGDISQGVGSIEHAEELHTAAMQIYRREGDLAREAEALASLGNISAASGDLVKAEGLLLRALALVRSVGDASSEARVLGRLGMVLQEAQRSSEARIVHMECLEASRRINARHNEVVALLNLATVDFTLALLDDARARYGDAMRAARELRDARLMGYALTGLGEVARQNGETDIARGLFERSVMHFRRSDDQGGLAAALLGSGRVEVLGGDAARARGLLAEARDIAVQQNARYAGALALALLALLAARRGSHEEALAAMVESGAMVEGVRAGDAMRIELQFLHALVLRVLGKKVEGDRKILRAEQILLQSTAELSSEERERVFGAMSPHREILACAAMARTSTSSREKDPSGTVAV